MKTFTAVRNAIKATLDGIEGIGTIQKFERYADKHKELKTFYATGNEIKGGYIRRGNFLAVTPDGGVNFTRTTGWQIHYIRSFLDDSESSESFDLMLDLIAEEFDKDMTMNGVVENLMQNDKSGIQLLSSEPAMFGGVLVHFAKMSLVTVECYIVP